MRMQPAMADKLEGKDVVTKFYEMLIARRRRRALANIRRAFARAGYPLDDFRDSQIENALMLSSDDIATATMNAKTIYRTIKRLNLAAKNESESTDEFLITGR